MRPFRPTAGVLTTALVLLSLFLAAGCTTPTRAAHEGPASGHGRPAETSPRAERAGVKPEGETLSASIPAEDARGEPVPGLPRQPGSVRVGYSERDAGGLMLVRAAYLTREGPDAVRRFYRGVFREEEWQVANVEYSGDGWRFLVLRGVREAGVEVLPRGGGSEVKVELSGPAQGFGASAGGSKR